MSLKRNFLGAIGFALMTLGISLPVQAQSLSESKLSTASTYTASEMTASELMAAEPVVVAAPAAAETLTTEPVMADAELAYPVGAEIEAETEVAQTRRQQRARLRANSPDFIGIGADIGTAEDFSFAAMGKLSISPDFAVRPSVLIGDGFAILAPVTYEFTRYNAEVEADRQRFQIRPYAGVGASYVDTDDDSSLGAMLAVGADVPISRQFTINAQANYAGIFSDSDNFGVTMGLGYNFNNLIRE